MVPCGGGRVARRDGPAARTTRFASEPLRPTVLPSTLSAPVAQSPERDASNVGAAGQSPAGSAAFRCAERSSEFAPRIPRACLLSSALLGIRGVRCKSTVFRHCSRSPTSHRPSRCSRLRLGRPGRSRLAAPKRHARRRVRNRPRAPGLRQIAHGQKWAIRFYEEHGFRQVTPAKNDRLLRK